MNVAKGISQLNQQLELLAFKNKTIGFVPTMGALHTGHLHLVSQAAMQNDISVCSIFVNPTQFNNQGDFDKYPRNDAQDLKLLKETGVDIVYFPEYSEIYPDEKPKLEDYSDDYLFRVYEGEFRPGHFQGVVTVVMRLFEHIKPTKAYFGLKDYQQYLVIKRATPSFYNGIEIVGIPTVRSKEGLALSSRNKRLSTKELDISLAMSKALHYLKEFYGKKELSQTLQSAKEIISKSGMELEYLDVCSKETLKAVNTWQHENQNIAVCSAFMGPVRLIDNIIF